MNEPTALLPCPFCGETHALTVDNLAGDDWYVECGACKVQQHAIYPTCDAAIAAWNRRAAVQEGEEQPRLTEDQIRAIFNAMPGGTQGFCRDWGYLTFARAIEDALPERRLALGAIRNSTRYSFLRRGPDRNIDYCTPGIPWVVAISNEHGIPTSVPCNGGRLDAAIDAAMSAAPGAEPADPVRRPSDNLPSGSQA